MVGAALAAAALVALSPTASQARERFDTKVLAQVPFPGYPAQGYVHPNGRVYEGTYINPDAGVTPSRVFEFDGHDGTLRRSWSVPGQKLSGQQAVQVTTSDAQGDLVVLDNDPARVLKLDRDSGEFRVYSTFSDIEGGSPPRPNYGAWGPDGSLYVTDYGQGLIWRVPPGGGPALVWLRDTPPGRLGRLRHHGLGARGRPPHAARGTGLLRPGRRRAEPGHRQDLLGADRPGGAAGHHDQAVGERTGRCTRRVRHRGQRAPVRAPGRAARADRRGGP